MPLYMTQKMSSGVKKPITFYRKQSSPHVSHEESSKFTTDAKSTYATERSVPVGSVEEGTYKSGQGVPTGGDTQEI